MRFFEFVEDDGAEQLVIVLRNYIGRAASKKAAAKLNWAGLNKILKTNSFDFIADYQTFKAMYDSSTAIQNLVKNFNQDGIELNVPGAPDAEKEPTQDGTSSQEKVDQMAASAAPQQLAQQTATPQL